VIILIKIQHLIVFFIHVNVSSTYTNILEQIHKLEKIKIEEFNSAIFFRSVSIVEDKKDWVNENIDKEIFEKLKMEEYKKDFKDKNEINKETIFKDELKFESIGSYSDLDVEEDFFDEFNNKHSTILEIEKEYLKHNEEELILFLKNTLENKSDVYLKYKDEKLNIEQFQHAKETIQVKNEEIKKRTPKPTHHLMIPFSFDINPDCFVSGLESKNIEQKSVLKFTSEYLNFYKSQNASEKTEQTSFIRDLFEEIDWCINISPDKDWNNIVFNYGYKHDDSSKYKKEYHQTVNEIKALNYYSNKKNIK